LTLSLGTLQASPLELAAGYAVFANGGHRVVPYFIDRIENAAGEIVFQAKPRAVCEECEQEARANEILLTGGAGEPVRAAPPVEPRKSLPPAERIAERVISDRNAYLITDMMQDVIRRGTGARARELGRNDLAGK